MSTLVDAGRWANALRLRGARSRAATGRGRRVVALVGVVGFIGLTDLALTVWFMATTGFPEANPLGRLIAAHGPVFLAAFKLVTIGVNASILLVLRHRVAAELGAWLAGAVVLVLAVQWIRFVAFARTDAFELTARSSHAEHLWTRFPQ